MKYVILIFAAAAAMWAQQPEQPPAGAPKPRPEPRNLQVLKVRGEEIMPIMRSFTALGVQCVFCHVEKNFPSDDNPKKLVARKMIEMTGEINAKFADGKRHVSCYTCHRGENEPKLMPPQHEGN